MSESGEGLALIDKPQKPSGFLSNLRLRFLRKRPGPPNSLAEKAADGNNPVARAIEFQFNGENLKLAEPIFFHTAPARSLDSIKRNGLFSDSQDPNMGRGIGYSLFFGFEREKVRGDPRVLNNPNHDMLSETPEDYVLTVWKAGPDLKRVRNDVFAGRFMNVKAKPENATQVPGEFFVNSPLGFTLRDFMSQNVRKLGPEYFLAAIPLNRTVRDEILKQMVLAEDGQITADQIEQNLLGIMKKQDVVLKEGVSLAGLVHQMTVSIEKDLMRYAMIPAMKKADSFPLPALQKALVYRSNCNDPVTAAYLEKVITRLVKIIRQKDSLEGYKPEEILQKLHKDLENLRNGGEIQSVGGSAEADYYGTYHIQDAAYRLRQRL